MTDPSERQAEEIYDLKKDPEQLENVAAQLEHAKMRGQLSTRLAGNLKATGDPRVCGEGEKFDEYPYLGGAPTYPGKSRE